MLHRVQRNMTKILKYLNVSAYDYASLGGGYNHDIQICQMDGVLYNQIVGLYPAAGFDKLISEVPKDVRADE